MFEDLVVNLSEKEVRDYRERIESLINKES